MVLVEADGCCTDVKSRRVLCNQRLRTAPAPYTHLLAEHSWHSSVVFFLLFPMT